MRKLLLLAPVLLLASCHSEQVVLQSHSPVSEPIATAPAVALDSTLTATVVVHRPEATAAPAATAAPLAATKLQTQPAQQSRLAGGLRPLSRLATATIARPMARHLAHRIQRQRTTEGAAESGLGNIALFFIVALLAVLAGLAALVNVIFSVGFFTALGYTAAGLVVLFLLYSLLSGGKKKK